MIGDRDNPIRVSSFPMLVRCPRRTMLYYMGLMEDSVGPAAHTGTLLGAAVESWHKIGQIEKAFDDAIQRTMGVAPDADVDLVRKMLEGYVADPRNAAQEAAPADSIFGKVLNVSLEVEVLFSLPPHEFDVTREPIWCVGHIDQIRERHGRYSVWDVKAGRRLGGPALLSEHALQIAGYVVGASEMTGESIHPGGVIRTQDYVTKSNPGPVFFECPYTRQDCIDMLGSVRLAVALARTGSAPPIPTEACQWACLGGPAQCLSILRAGTER